ncbi:hypothetical protein ERJ75_000066600 [Trypanosoma vivax]|uniref:Uncharacterized protein n=1 Tax=Trypanosoma vivax (strain Y486) TaxID=1055687 RepID=G0TVN8_TRYVY|nr:hypothetical protein TRVL_03644 [Trypanosoma vivax]KAH8620656.1 hypothetical protein ERJ75_000066600 [Trypanosoma vivax]CCC48004.1 conserved hypothetical protein [Trypanosoma vivax Y486]
MSDSPHALQRAEAIGDAYVELLQCALKLEKDVEKYYLREEAIIRERVMLLDEMQANIAEERRCLEVDHQECREQISTARRSQQSLRSEESRLAQISAQKNSHLEREERVIAERLMNVSERLREETRELELLTERMNRCEKNEKLLERREMVLSERERELERAQKELKALEDEIEERRESLEKKHEDVVLWNRSLENREKELARCQEEFRDDLKRLEEDERRYGIHKTSSKVVPLVSLREVMDDHNMSIEKESQCEDIDIEEEEGDELSA